MATPFALKDQNGLDFSSASLRSPKSDRLLASAAEYIECSRITTKFSMAVCGIPAKGIEAILIMLKENPEIVKDAKYVQDIP